jgi:hypothetical protein
MGNPYRHPISTPVPELQGIASIASRTPASSVDAPEQAGAVPAGWKLVPVELTHAMLDATCDTAADDEAMRNRWAALLDASPRPPAIDRSLQDALQPFLHAAEPIIHSDRERWKPDEWTKRWKGITVGQFRALYAAAPTPLDAGPGELPAGTIWKSWHGGRKPADWSGEAVRFRSGEVVYAPPAGTIWKLGWDHHYGPGDIIAYTSKAPPQTPPDAGSGSDGAGTCTIAGVEFDVATGLRIRALQAAEDFIATIDSPAAHAIYEQVHAALATQPGDGGRS